MGTVFLFVGFFCFLSSAAAMLSPNGVNFEVVALMDIKRSLIDPHGVLNWDENAVDPCGIWTMVGCSHDNFVISLLLQDNNISGPIPAELGRLPKLQELDLSDNLLTGEIPPSLSQLKSLQYLYISCNSCLPPLKTKSLHWLYEIGTSYCLKKR